VDVVNHRLAADGLRPTRETGADRVGTEGDCEVRRTGDRRAEPGHDRRLVGRPAEQRPLLRKEWRGGALYS
jgi:hypothetical protein